MLRSLILFFCLLNILVNAQTKSEINPDLVGRPSYMRDVMRHGLYLSGGSILYDTYKRTYSSLSNLELGYQMEFPLRKESHFAILALPGFTSMNYEYIEKLGVMSGGRQSWGMEFHFQVPVMLQYLSKKHEGWYVGLGAVPMLDHKRQGTFIQNFGGRAALGFALANSKGTFRQELYFQERIVNGTQNDWPKGGSRASFMGMRFAFIWN